MSFDTDVTNKVMRRLKEFDAEIINHTFSAQNEILFKIRLSFTEKLLDHFKQNNIQAEKTTL